MLAMAGIFNVTFGKNIGSVLYHTNYPINTTAWLPQRGSSILAKGNALGSKMWEVMNSESVLQKQNIKILVAGNAFGIEEAFQASFVSIPLTQGRCPWLELNSPFRAEVPGIIFSNCEEYLLQLQQIQHIRNNIFGSSTICVKKEAGHSCEEHPRR